MKVVALILSTFVLALLCHEVQAGCGSWSMSTYTVDEGDFSVPLTAQQDPDDPQSLQYSTRGDSAIGNEKYLTFDIVTQYFHIIYMYVAGSDYAGSSGILTFSNGVQSEVTIFVLDDEDLESTESFFVDLRLLGTDTVCDTATVVILDEVPTTSPPTTPRMLILNTNS